ncbi:hypothetical protein OESDEN_10967 [Oesophagostomum dentatum]|uniref:Uncharacterized protein n=1 Tax=Oesophagostomum dentatum TaxID=61180 RepID=A0A0B1SW81_OESDE|nr:hypothetical protein OESDEN_10967 [Oesophagostomum dentatum]
MSDDDYCSCGDPREIASAPQMELMIGIVAAIVRHDMLLLVHLVASVIAIAVATASAVISLFDYKTIGTDQWTTKNNVFCILSDYNPRRIQHIYKDSRQNDFAKCIWQFKLGLSVIILSILGAIFLAALNTLSIVLCAKRIKQWPKFTHH